MNEDIKETIKNLIVMCDKIISTQEEFKKMLADFNVDQPDAEEILVLKMTKWAKQMETLAD